MIKRVDDLKKRIEYLNARVKYHDYMGRELKLTLERTRKELKNEEKKHNDK